MYALFDGALDLRLFKVNLFLRVCKCLNGALDMNPFFTRDFCPSESLRMLTYREIYREGKVFERFCLSLIFIVTLKSTTILC